MKKLEQKYYAKWMVLPALILFMVFFIIPNCASFVMGFTDWSLFFFDDPRWCGFDNFVRLFGEKNFWVAVKNTFYFAIVTVIGKNVFGFLLALLVQKQTRYNTFLRAAFFMPITISALVVAIIFVSIYNPTYGLLNKLLSAVGLESLTCDWLYTKGTSMNAICAMNSGNRPATPCVSAWRGCRLSPTSTSRLLASTGPPVGNKFDISPCR